MSCHPSGRTKVPPQPPVDESMVNVGGDFEDLPCFEVGTVFLFCFEEGENNKNNPFFLKDETKNPKRYMSYMYYYIYIDNFFRIYCLYTPCFFQTDSFHWRT